MKAIKKKSILWVIVIISAISWITYEINDEIQVANEAKRKNEEWAENYKYSWRTMKLNSSEDLIIGNMRIADSDLSEEEKAKERANLWIRYYNASNSINQ